MLRASALAGAFRVNEVVPDLIRVLNKKALSGIDFEGKVPVVKALGQIGDCRSLDTLEKILSSNTPFFGNTQLERTINEAHSYTIHLASHVYPSSVEYEH